MIMKAITFSPEALLHLDERKKSDPKILAKIVSLITDTASTPFTGIGKPEPLKHSLKGSWSRRITDEHRLVYKVKETTIWVVSCRHHY
jgi:toxin YoeB